MGRTGFALLAVFGVLFALQSARADSPAALENFYRESIEKKVMLCQEKAKLAYCDWENLQREGERALQKIHFYEAEKEELVQEMLRRNLGEDPRKVELFLNKAFHQDKTNMLSERR